MTGPRLGEILRDLQACTADQIRKGLENQVIYGGRLGTNLLELGVLEEDLARALGRRHQRPCLFGDLRVDPAAAKLLGPEQADRYQAVPYLATERKLALLVRDPDDLQTLDEIAFLTGREVYPIVSPEARIWVLLKRLYGIDRHPRGIDAEGSPHAPAAPPQPKSAPPSPDLMDEAEFETLYHGGIPEKAPEPAQAAAAPDTFIEASDLGALRASLGRGVEGRAPPGPLFTPAPVPMSALEASPLLFADAVRFLEGVAERSAIAHTVLRYARSRFRRAVLFTVHRGIAAGWEGLGEGLDRRAVLSARVGLGQPGALETVVATRAHFLGPLQKTDQNAQLVRMLGGGAPRNAFLLPILALGRVVNVLYADNGRGGLVEGGDLGELLILADKIAQAYAGLVKRRA